MVPFPNLGNKFRYTVVEFHAIENLHAMPLTHKINKFCYDKRGKKDFERFMKVSCDCKREIEWGLIHQKRDYLVPCQVLSCIWQNWLGHVKIAVWGPSEIPNKYLVLKKNGEARLNSRDVFASSKKFPFNLNFVEKIKVHPDKKIKSYVSAAKISSWIKKLS